MEIICANCRSYHICEVRKYFLSGRTPAHEMQKKIARGPDHFANMSTRIHKALAENCRFWAEDDID